ncbi:MFS general substrate transporter [Trametes versicolor FP-101664 SS1]|uniref:MFS general substrate transporter n=1 Tax=Trametes versicolor (strain FP-101664) TaxID=717944 RepID=UPI000462235B|nr:MFS general substrate transporter [Trametes versicolor FP-101664 SS1]EIW56969.1 MFS general substrate transporter [Trametes versicolor FP-101664 SS1]
MSFDDNEKHPPGEDVLSPVSDIKKTADDVNQRQVLRKLDFRLLPFVCLLFVLSFLDRTNIGNAKVAGLTADLHLAGWQYSLASAIFFVTYCLFEVPSNIMLKVMSPSKWIPIIMFFWGCIVLSMAFVKNFAGLVTARVFLGVTEAGLFPGVTFYLCTWYPKVEQAKRLAIFSSASSVAGAFGGLLAFAIEKMGGIGGLAGWAWIFLLEGLLTVTVAAVAYFVMYDYPETAPFLTERERAWLVHTLKTDNTGLSKDLKWRFLAQALRDPHSYLMISLLFFIFIPGYSSALFLPTIISGLGFSASHAQLLTIPPNLCALLTTILAGALSDRFRVRGPVIMAGTLLALAGYAILYGTSSPGAGYAGTIIATCGIFPCVPCTLAWTGANIGGEMKRGVVIAMVIGVGNLAGIVASFIYRPQDSPRYHLGHGINIACLCVVVVICIVSMLEFARLNRRKVAQCAREGITDKNTSEFVDMGDASPLYRFVETARFDMRVACSRHEWVNRYML